MNYKIKNTTPAYRSLAAYRYGGIKKKKKYPNGGMYGDNTVSSAGQMGNTASLVFQESDPAVLQAKIDAMNTEKERLNLAQGTAAEEVKQMESEGEQSVTDAATEKTKLESGVETVQGIGETVTSAIGEEGMDAIKDKASGLFGAKEVATADPLGIRAGSKLLSGKPLSLSTPSSGLSLASKTPGLSLQSTQLGAGTLGSGTLGGGSSILNTPTSQLLNTGSSGIGGTSNLLGSTNTFNPALMGDKPLSLSTDLMNTGKNKLLQTGLQETAKNTGTGLMSTTGVGAAGVGTGASKFLTSGAGIGTVASLAGMGVSALSDDGDATKLNFGEGTGAVLSGVGTGIGAAALAGTVMGSAVPVVGNIIGAAAGAIYGLGSALVGRNKARKAKREYERKIKEKKDKYNKELVGKMATATSQVRAAELKQKTYSGYDLGSNVTYRMGGQMKPLMKYGN